MSQSEVAKLREQIDREVAAMRLAMTGYAVVATHQTINYRLTRLGEHFDQLSGAIGKQQAVEVVANALQEGLDVAVEKPGLREVRQEHDLDAFQLAEAAGLPLRVESLAEAGGAVEKEIAYHLLDALNSLTNKHYTLNDVHINIK